MVEVVGDSTRDGRWELVRLTVDGERILSAEAEGLDRPLAGAERPRYGRRTRCGYVLQPGTVGLTDSVLPCGILVYVAYKDSPHILTRVIDRRPVLPGRKFDLTPKLAEELGIDGVQRIRWVFAR